MKRFLGAVALLCALAGGLLSAQNTSTFGNIVTTGVPCGSANCVYYQLPPGTAWVNVTVSGTWVGTLEIATTSAPNANYSNLNDVPWTALASETVNGTWSAATSGAVYLRARATAFSSGLARVDMASSVVGSPQYAPLFLGPISGSAGGLTQQAQYNCGGGLCGSLATFDAAGNFSTPGNETVGGTSTQHAAMTTMLNGTTLLGMPQEVHSDSIGTGALATIPTTQGWAYLVAGHFQSPFQVPNGLNNGLCANTSTPGCNHSVSGDDQQDLNNHLETISYPERGWVLQQIGTNDGAGQNRGYLNSITAISGGSGFSGTGTLLLSNFSNCVSTTATVTITSGVFTSWALTAPGTCSAVPTTATCTSGTATCTGSPVTINVTATIINGYTSWQVQNLASMLWENTPNKIAANAAGIQTTGVWTAAGSASSYPGAMKTCQAGATMTASNLPGDAIYVFPEEQYGDLATMSLSTDLGTPLETSNFPLGYAWSSKEGFTHGLGVDRAYLGGLQTTTGSYAPHSVTVIANATVDANDCLIVNAFSWNKGQFTAAGPFSFYAPPNPTVGLVSTAASGTPQTATTFSITGNVATVNAPGTYAAGQGVFFSGFANSYMNTSTQGTGASTVTVGGTGSFSFALTHADVGSTADAGSVYPHAAATEFALPTARDSVRANIGTVSGDGLVAKYVDTTACAGYQNLNGGPIYFPESFGLIGGDGQTHPNTAQHIAESQCWINAMAEFLIAADIGDSNNRVRRVGSYGSLASGSGTKSQIATGIGSNGLTGANGLGVAVQPDGSVSADVQTYTPSDCITRPASGNARTISSGCWGRQAQAWHLAETGTALSATVTFTFPTGTDAFQPDLACYLHLVENAPFMIAETYKITGLNGASPSIHLDDYLYKANNTTLPVFLANLTLVGSPATGFTVDIANLDTASADYFGMIGTECFNISDRQIALGQISVGTPFTTTATAPIGRDVLGSDGIATAPTFRWANELNTGWYRAGAQDSRYAINGSDFMRWIHNGTVNEEILASGNGRCWGSSGTSSIDTCTSRAAAGVFSVDDGTPADSKGQVKAASWLSGILYSAAGTALPTCNSGAKGTHATVTDATAPTWGSTYTSGGAVVSNVLCNGTSWVTE